ncbi:MAG: hypothetical protein CML36_05850 [Rhodobacteraceae bacterium]|nr:hypothetical protein [Paracoccaceae bacterium]
MTEIVKNNNSMAFDILETGSNNGTPSESKDFDSLFGNVDINQVSKMQTGEMENNEKLSADKSMQEIVDLLKDSGLNLNQEILSEIETQLKNLFLKLKSNIDAIDTSSNDQLNIYGNENFLHLMKFLEELRELVTAKNSGGAINRQLDNTLDQLRTKLNELIKTFFNNKVKLRASSSDKNAALEDSKNISESAKVGSYTDEKSKLIKGNTRELADKRLGRPDLADFNNSSVKVQSEKKFLTKPKSINSVVATEKETSPSPHVEGKPSETKNDLSKQNQTSNPILKEFSSESNTGRQPIGLTNKLDLISGSDSTSPPKQQTASQENSEKLLNNLNLLSKKWGDSLIEKLEKSIVDGIEELEISLTPKSLGKLNITINMQDNIAKINIIAETSSAALLLGEAESKLAQMMESSGLKLASLQTLNQQSGYNQKGREQAHKLASTLKKSSMEKKIPEEIVVNTEAKQEGLNLIA